MDANTASPLEGSEASDAIDAGQPVEQLTESLIEAAVSEAVEAVTNGQSDQLGAPAAAAAVAEADFSSAVIPASVVSSGSSAGEPSSNGTMGERGISIITAEATVLGDIITEGHIDVIGKVRGNIAAQGDVAVHGQVRGNIDGEKIGLYNSRVKGNLTAGQGVIVNDTSIIDGDVTTKNIIFDGKVRGNIAAESVVVLRSHSYCLGDVTAASLAVEPGAIINGTVRTAIEGDPEAPFDEII